MKILVLDDMKRNRISARNLLAKNHEVTTIGNYDGALDLLNSAQFDVFLTDLLLTPSRSKLISELYKVYLRQDMPLGTVLAFLALAKGIKHVAVVTNTNHHFHPASAAFDAFWQYSDKLHNVGKFHVGDATIVMANYQISAWFDKKSGDMISDTDLEMHEEYNAPEKIHYDKENQKWIVQKGGTNYHGLFSAKNWQMILEELVS